MTSTSPVQSKFDHYDMLAVILPGLIFLAEIYFIYKCNGDVMQLTKIETLPSPSITKSIVLIVMAFYAGEGLQILGKMIEPALWKLHGGDPYYWILPLSTRNKKTRKRIRCFRPTPSSILPSNTITFIRHRLLDNAKPLSCKSEPGTSRRKLTADILNGYYPRIRGTAYGTSFYKDTCISLLSKAHMFRGYGVVAIIGCLYTYFLVIRDCFSRISRDCICIDPSGISVSHILIALVASILTPAVIMRYRHYTIKYNRYLYEGFYSGVVQKKEEQGATKMTTEASISLKDKGTDKAVAQQADSTPDSTILATGVVAAGAMAPQDDESKKKKDLTSEGATIITEEGESDEDSQDRDK